MEELGKSIANSLSAPKTIELIGDVGAGKTTLTKGIIAGLGVASPVTSPSFTISNTYFSRAKNLTIKHYDFYRLADPGLMLGEISESTSDPETISIIEWGESVVAVLPDDRLSITISQDDFGNRLVEIK